MAETPQETPQDTLKSKLSKFIHDIATLQVTTVSGNLAVETVITDKKVDFDKIWTQLSTSGGGAGKLTLIASSKVDFDKDVLQYVKADLTDAEKELVKLHNEAVKNSTEARKAAIESAVGIAKELLPNVLK